MSVILKHRFHISQSKRTHFFLFLALLKDVKISFKNDLNVLISKVEDPGEGSMGGNKGGTCLGAEDILRGQILNIF